MVSHQRKRELKQAFDLVDRNGDGSVTVDELEAMFKSLKMPRTRAECRSIIADVDRNGDGKIQFREFLQYMTKYDRKPRQMSKSELMAAFRIFDTNNDGYISRRELWDTMKRLDFHLSKDELDAMMEECDTDRNGKLDYKEFVRMMVIKYDNV